MTATLGNDSENQETGEHQTKHRPSKSRNPQYHLSLPPRAVVLARCILAPGSSVQSNFRLIPVTMLLTSSIGSCQVVPSGKSLSEYFHPLFIAPEASLSQS